MTATAVAAFTLGATMAAAVCAAVTVTRRGRPNLAAINARLDAALTDTAAGGERTLLENRVGQRVVATMTGLGRSYRTLEADLPIAGTTLIGVIGRSVIFGAVGAATGAFIAVVAAGAGIHLPAAFAVALAVALAAICSRTPVMATKQRAANRRASFVHALGVLLDFLAIELAAGAGIKDALARSLDRGDGWAFQLMRDRVTVARDSGAAEAGALEQLGAELGIAELVELGGSIALARSQGATARDTLIAKARALRQRQITTAEQVAREGTERAAAPIALQFYAVMFAVMYVLMSRLQHGLV